MRFHPPASEESTQTPVYDRTLFLKLLRYGKPYWYWMALAVLLIIAGMAMEILGPYLTKIAVDRYILTGQYAGLYLIAALYLGVLLGNFIFRYAQMMTTQYVGQRIMLDLRQDIFSHLQTLHQQFFDRNPVGRLITRVTSDVESLNQIFTQGLVMIFGDILLIVGIVFTMFSLHFGLALWTLSVVPFIGLLSFLFRRKVRHSFGEIRRQIARINSFLQERISGMAIVQLFNRQKEDFRQFRKINWQYTAAYIRTIFYFAIFFPLVELLGAVALALIIYRGAFFLEHQQVTFGILIAFIQYVRRFFRPISDLSEKYNVLQSALAASERIFTLLDTQPEIVSPANGYRTNRLTRGIEFRDVWFTYDSEQVLQDINLYIPPGKRYGLVGHTGAGKTTISRLVGRFYDVQRGRVLVDGVDVREWDLTALRQLMAVVPQEVFLFSGTVLENISLNDPRITRERAIWAARMVHAHHFIEKMPGGYEARIQERGGNLSQGQKQLLALARALAFDPQILILDEATANIDSESEHLIQEALKVVLQGRTAIVIAHRLSTIQAMDQIVVMHRARIREMGTHQELLKQRGLYYRLYQLQFANHTGISST